MGWVESAGSTAIADYAAIGDCRTIALVSRQGSVDWLCLPHPSAASFFGALLDSRRGGRLAVQPRNVLRIERAYIDGTNVLETTFHCRGGTLRVTDFVTIATVDRLRETLCAEHELVRLLECTAGEVQVDVLYEPRPDYARHLPQLVDRGHLGWMCSYRGLAAFLRGDIELQPESEATLSGGALLRTGDKRRLVFSASENDAGAFTPLGEIDDCLDAAVRWWRNWSGQCTYEGPYREQVTRSCLALKLLTYSLSGAVLAAATTSIPVMESGEGNWDYRYCWLRDSSLVLQAFMDLGFHDESRAFLGWLLHATALTQPRLQVMYDLYGRTRLKERELSHLAGHGGIGPVRVGNGAHDQLQLDVYGDVIRAAAEFVARGGELEGAEKRLLAGLGQSVCELWRRPDHSIWESRGPPRHYTYSKVMCWVALDQLLRLHESESLGVEVETFSRERERIREDVERHGFDAELNSYVAYYGGCVPDASLLLLARYGYVEPDDPRMVGTWRLIDERLGADGLLFRYPLAADGYFGICSFWLVDYLIRLGKRPQAVRLFESLLGLANDVGLYAEEFSTSDRSLRGNFPQAFTHVGLITAALALARSQTHRSGEAEHRDGCYDVA